jgi:hypothetical protein
VGDLSRPLFDCPWALSKVINEAVKFLEIPPHSLHLSMELRGQHSHITDQPHQEDDLVCLLMLGGDLRSDKDGNLREWRVFGNELDTNFKDSLHFSDRKYHFSRPGQDKSEASDTMEYKFARLHSIETDYEMLVVALKGYQLHTHCRPISIQRKDETDLTEQAFLREWAEKPQSLDMTAIQSFVDKVELGLLEENHTCKLDRHKLRILERIEEFLINQNDVIKSYE